MGQKLIILRGNSGSGKSTVAKKLQTKMGYGTMLVPQDVVRREILRVEDKTNNPSKELVKIIVEYGKKIGYDVIIEGIFGKEKHGEMLKNLIDQFDEAYIYYFDISFGETLKRHSKKPNAAEFGEQEMRAWWKEKDYLGIETEKLITDNMKEDEVVEIIYKDVNGL